jgi:hypothetical protein
MASERLGRAKAGSGKTYEVFWDPRSGDVYVACGGKTYVGRAASPAHAMRMCEAWLASK